MAFLFEDQEEEEKQPGENPEIAGTGGGGPGEGTGQSGNAPPMAPQKQFVDIGSYLDANREQTGRLASAVSDQLGQQVSGLKGEIDKAEGDFSNRVKAGTTGYDAGLADEAFSKPTDFVKDQNKMGSFTKMRDARYTGPQDFQTIFPDLPGRINEATERAKGVDTAEGRKQMLMNLYPNATPGMVSLDEMLIGADPSARTTMRQAAGQFGTLNDYLDQASGRSKTAADKATADTDTARNTVAQRLADATGGFQTKIGDTVSSARTSAQRNADLLKQGILSGELNDAELAQIGMTRAQWDQLKREKGMIETGRPFQDTKAQYGQKVDLGQFYSALNPEVEINDLNALSPEDYAYEAALQQLSGGGFDVLPDDVSQAGKAPTNLARYGVDDSLSTVGGLRQSLDDNFLDQYKNYNLGAFNEAGWINEMRDPWKAEAYGKMADIIERNKQNPLAKQELAAELRRFIELANTTKGEPTPTEGGDAFQPTEPTTTEQPTDRLRTVDGKQMWWDGKSWVDAPKEFRGYVNGGYTEKFNYVTGQYEPTGWTGTEAPKTDKLGKRVPGPGVVRAF